MAEASPALTQLSPRHLQRLLCDHSLLDLGLPHMSSSKGPTSTYGLSAAGAVLPPHLAPNRGLQVVP